MRLLLPGSDNSYWDQHYADESDSCASVDPLPNGHPIDPPGSVGTVVDLWRAAADGSEGPARGWNNSCGAAFPSNMGDRQKYDQGTSEDYTDWPTDYYNFVTGASCQPGPLAAESREGAIVTAHNGFEEALFEAEVLDIVGQGGGRPQRLIDFEQLRKPVWKPPATNGAESLESGQRPAAKIGPGL